MGSFLIRGKKRGEEAGEARRGHSSAVPLRVRVKTSEPATVVVKIKRKMGPSAWARLSDAPTTSHADGMGSFLIRGKKRGEEAGEARRGHSSAVPLRVR